MSLSWTENWEILPVGSGSKIVVESSLMRVTKITFFVSHPALQSLYTLLYFLEPLHRIFSNEKVLNGWDACDGPGLAQVPLVKPSDETLGFLCLLCKRLQSVWILSNNSVLSMLLLVNSKHGTVPAAKKKSRTLL